MSEFSPETRASDADRDRVARRLQEHFAQGRLDSDDFNERLTRVYRARTGAELERITEDLPERDLADLRPAPRRPAGRSPGRRRGVLREPIVQIPWLIWSTRSRRRWCRDRVDWACPHAGCWVSLPSFASVRRVGVCYCS
ncbi:hypothetical protein DEF24_01785 [Marinitenerispora sediminis]|uniref:DUF1707 domain-containing protein n=1 Tax=Marinitenerispora sediminis TaxID=1931232 RepID=A0A368TB28_9ACTN|nr:DUF1707 domain-containing protein [Marinitenerispora sediminis]RCV62285.1 hypothetical protein DEF24_01785 [Marinitenerispora sediminis]